MGFNYPHDHAERMAALEKSTAGSGWGRDETMMTTDIDVLANVAALSVARVSFKFPDDTRFPSLPVRAGDRGLIYPLSGVSYCTGAELVVAL